MGERGISMGDLLLFSVFPLTLPLDLMNSPQDRCHSPLEQSEITEALFLLCFVSDLSQPYFSACFLLTPEVVNPIERNGRCPNPEKYICSWAKLLQIRVSLVCGLTFHIEVVWNLPMINVWHLGKSQTALRPGKQRGICSWVWGIVTAKWQLKSYRPHVVRHL